MRLPMPFPALESSELSTDVAVLKVNAPEQQLVGSNLLLLCIIGALSPITNHSSLSPLRHSYLFRTFRNLRHEP